MLYLLTHAGLAGLKGLGLVSWGSMDSFTLTAIPLFILMAEILQESKLRLRVYRGLSILVPGCPADCCRPISRAAPSLPRSAAPAW